jgi:trimeric autotransporter adhesin
LIAVALTVCSASDNTTTTTTTPTTTTTSPTPAPTVPPGCPQSATAWLQATPAQISALNAVCFSALTLADTEQLVALQCAALSGAQLAALSGSCEGLFGDCVGALVPATVAHLSVACAANLTARAVAGFVAPQVPALSAGVLAAIRTAAVSALSPAAVAALSDAQFDAFSLDQLLYLSAAQLAVLSPARCAGLSALQTTFLAPDSCAGLNASCALAFQSWNGLQGGCIGAFAAETLLRAPPALLNSVSNAGWSGVTTAQFEALVGNATSLKLVEALGVQTLALANATVIGQVSQFFLANNMTALNASTIANVTTFFASASWITVAQLIDSSTVSLSAQTIAKMPPSSVAALRGLALKSLSDDAYSGFSDQQLAAMQPEAVGNISGPGVVHIDAQAFVGLCARLDQLSTDAVVNVTLSQLNALAGSSCRGDQVCVFLRNISDRQREVAAANSTVFVQFDESCGLTGTVWVNTLTIVMCIVTVAVFLGCCALVEVRRKKRNNGVPLPR